MDDLNCKHRKEMDANMDILFTKTVKTGNRIYYLDVKENLNNGLYIAVTESKKKVKKTKSQVVYERHKLFLYRDDFKSFLEGLNEVVAYIQNKESKVFSISDTLSEDSLFEESVTDDID